VPLRDWAQTEVGWVEGQDLLGLDGPEQPVGQGELARDQAAVGFVVLVLDGVLIDQFQTEPLPGGTVHACKGHFINMTDNDTATRKTACVSGSPFQRCMTAGAFPGLPASALLAYSILRFSN